jgi:hypothetical protein
MEIQMTIDRLLIVCSIIELGYVGYKEGIASFTPFQWVAFTLLIIKLIVVLLSWYRRAH